MNKLFGIVGLMGLCACAFPSTPGEGNLLNGSKQFKSELFQSGARGEIVVQMSDNVSSDGFFGIDYDNMIAFKNTQSGEVFFLKMDSCGYDWAMLPVGQYQVTNLYLQSSYTTQYQFGNTTHVQTHIERIEHFEGNDKIVFNVKPGTVSYIGHFNLIKPDNKVAKDGKINVNTYKITDDSAKIPEKMKSKWFKEFGQNYVVGLATVK